jgi:hypothetical protein
MPMTMAAYAQFAHDQVMNRSPGDAMRGYAAGWRNVLDDIYRAGKNPDAPGGQFEMTGLVVSRWEFLGGLYCGATGKTDVKHAAVYARRFMPKYDALHNLSGSPGCGTDCSEFFTMLRNKPLHGFTPAAVKMHNQDEVLAWGIGDAPGQHLAIEPSGVLIDCPTLANDLCGSMDAYADVLDINTETPVIGLNSELTPDPHDPQARWKRCFWARFCPVHLSSADWLSLGERKYGIPL